MSNTLSPSPTPTERNHQGTSSRDNSYNSIDEDSLQEPHDSTQTFIVEHIDEKSLMDISLLESKLHEPIKNYDISIEKENNGFSEDSDCTTVTLSTSTSDRSGSSWGKTRQASNPWAARFVRTTNEQGKTLPLPLAVDQTHTVSPLSTPSPTGQRSRKVFNEQVLEAPHPPLKQFGAQSDAPQVAALQIQSLEAIMAKKKNDGRLGHWWRKDLHQQQQQQEKEYLEEEAASTSSSMKSVGDKTATFRWGRFLGRSSSSSTMTLNEDETIVTGDGEDSQVAHEKHQRKSWKNRFSFRPSLMDTMLDDIDNPYFDSVSLSSECSSSFDWSTSSVSEIKSSENDSTMISNNGISQSRRWSRLWRAQEFSQEAPTVHMI
ncbi:MAG: hypothetical protein SGBAC_010597 [Bacillariaceae sp.]